MCCDVTSCICCSCLSESEVLELLQENLYSIFYILLRRLSSLNVGDPPEDSSQDMRKGAQSDNTLLVLFLSSD